MVLSQIRYLSLLIIGEVAREGEQIPVRARTPGESVTCPGCRVETVRVHSYHQRSVTDVPVDARRLLVVVRIRRLICPTHGCRQTFREQLPQRAGTLFTAHTPLTGQIGAMVRELASRAGMRALSTLSVRLSRHTALHILLRLLLSQPRVQRGGGVDDLAVRGRLRHATVLINAETREHIDVLPGRTADVLETWLRAHSEVQVVCRDGSGAYAEAIHRALPEAIRPRLYSQEGEQRRNAVNVHGHHTRRSEPQALIESSTSNPQVAILKGTSGYRSRAMVSAGPLAGH